MPAKRIIACLDVKDGMVVKGVRFKDHVISGGIEELAKRYRDQGADELVFYDITASSDQRSVDRSWISKVARLLDIPFCVAGGIRSVEDARAILHAGADKISVNSPALERPQFISDLAQAFGVQCVVVGIDSKWQDGAYRVFRYTGRAETTERAAISTRAWSLQAQQLGAGEIVLNCMGHDGTKSGFDIDQLSAIRPGLTIPLVASGGAGSTQDFVDVFKLTEVDAALAAGALHRQELTVPQIKAQLTAHGIEVRL